MNRIPLLAALAAVLTLLTLPAGAAANLAFPDGDIVREGLGDSGATVTWATPVFDSPNGSLRGTPNCTPDSGTALPTGTTKVECRAVVEVCPTTPQIGVCFVQLTQGEFTVRVTPGAGPELAGVADRSVTAAAGRDTARVDYALPTASDPSGVAAGSVACSPASGSAFTLGDTTVTCSARDTVGNESSTTFGVTVVRAAAVPQPQPPSRPAIPQTPAGPGAAPDAPRALARRVSLRRLNVRRGAARVVVSCPAGNAVACRGTLRLKLRKRSIARKRFALAPGQRRTVRLRLSRGARRMLARRTGRVRLRAVAVTRGEAGQRLTAARTFRVRARR